MVREDLIAAIKNALERNETIDEAKQSLINAGYNRGEVERAAKTIEDIKKTRGRIPTPPPKFKR